MSKLVPSDAFPNGLAALSNLVTNASSASAAVAFVSEPGVRLLRDALASNQGLEVEVVARGAGITSPEALLMLRDELGVEVSVVIGRYASAFHPKLWLVRSHDRLSVLSGSGNLTEGGLRDNDEQFEIIELEHGTEVAASHEQRFELLTANAFPLDDLEHTPIWDEWRSVVNRQRVLQGQLRSLEARLASREVILSRKEDKAELVKDLQQLYDRTVAARLARPDGKRYVPSRFKQGIDRVRLAGDPVLLVTRICRRQTEGFDVILAADRPDLTVEALAVDQDRPYHDLFSERTLRLSAERLRQFPSWESEA